MGSDALYADVQRTMRLAAAMNSGWHTEEEVRQCLREITGHDVPDDVPPDTVVAGVPAMAIRMIKCEGGQPSTSQNTIGR